MPQKEASNFNLRTFTENDYDGIVALRNSLYPNHPTTVNMVRHNDQAHKGKIKQKRFILEENEAIIV